MKYYRIMGRHAGQESFHLFIEEANSPDEAMREVFKKNPTVAESYYAGEASPSQIQEHNSPDDLPGE
jgi:hypothetical protein